MFDCSGTHGTTFAKIQIFYKFAKEPERFEAMKFTDYENAFSPARMYKYLKVFGGDTTTALTLYRHNIKLCQKFYGILNIFEIVLRNAINEHYKAHFSDQDWIKHQIIPGGMLENHPQHLIVEKAIYDLDKAGKYTNDRIVSSVSFGFWTHLFSRYPFIIGGQSLLQVLPSRIKGYGQRTIYNELQYIKNFRNRIAHHEAICFDSTGAKNTQPARDKYAMIIKYVQFLGYSENQLYHGLDVLPDKILQKIDSL